MEFEQRGKEKAEYGEGLLKRLGEDLTRRFGRGFSWRNIFYMRSFYLGWEILQTPSAIFEARARMPADVGVGESFPAPSGGSVRAILPTPSAISCEGEILLRPLDVG